MKNLAASLLIIAVSSPAYAAGSWNLEPDGGGGDCSSIKDGTCYYDFSDTTDPKVLAIQSKCLPISVELNPDEDGTNIGAEIQVYDCSESTLSTNHCTKILADTDGDGVVNDVTLDGSTLMRRGMYGVVTNLLGVDVTANPGSDDARVKVTCGRN